MSRGTLAVTCSGCTVWDVQWLDEVLVVPQPDGSLLLLFVCETCLSGHQRVSHPAPRAAVLASGAGVRRPGQSGWPPMIASREMPSRPGVRPAPLFRLARMVQRRYRSEGNH